MKKTKQKKEIKAKIRAKIRARKEARKKAVEKFGLEKTWWNKKFCRGDIVTAEFLSNRYRVSGVVLEVTEDTMRIFTSLGRIEKVCKKGSIIGGHTEAEVVKGSEDSDLYVTKKEIILKGVHKGKPFEMVIPEGIAVIRWFSHRIGLFGTTGSRVVYKFFPVLKDWENEKIFGGLDEYDLKKAPPPPL